MDFAGLEFEGERFKNLDLSEASFVGTRFDDCVFENCNLSNVQLQDARMQDVRFLNCKLLGLDFSKCDNFLISLGFENSLVSTCSFTGLKLNETVFKACQLFDCQFIETDLTEADFEQTDLRGTQFQNANLTAASLVTACNYHIDPNQNILKKAKFSVPEVLGLLDSFGVVIE